MSMVKDGILSGLLFNTAFSLFYWPQCCNYYKLFYQPLFITGLLFPGTSPLEPVMHPITQVFKFQIVGLSLVCTVPLVQTPFI